MSKIYTFQKITKQEFNELASSLSPLNIPIEQTPVWGEFDNSISGRKYLGSYRYDSEKLLALASATLYKQRGRNWIWIKHGPLFASVPNTEIIKKMCTTLKTQFSDVNGIKPLFIRLTMPSQVKSLVLPFEHTMYDETVMVDLLMSQEEILAHMSQGGRRGIRKAEKAGIEILEVDAKKAAAEFEQLYYPLIQETAKRDGFSAHSASLYKNMLNKLSDYTKLYVAKNDKKVVAWALTTEYNKQALYYYGASSQTGRELHAPYLLHFEIIKAMKQRGNETYDFMGIAGKNYPALNNVTQFKLKFSKEITKVNQTYDLPLNKLRYSSLAQLIKLRRRLS